MDERLDRLRELIRGFLRDHYGDEQLVAALAHARDGKLSYSSCCCLIGIPTADHALQGFNSGQMKYYGHLRRAQLLGGADEADRAFCQLGYVGNFDEGRADALRRRRLIPILLGEIRRRSQLRQESEGHERAETVPV